MKAALFVAALLCGTAFYACVRAFDSPETLPTAAPTPDATLLDKAAFRDSYFRSMHEATVQETTDETRVQKGIARLRGLMAEAQKREISKPQHPYPHFSISFANWDDVARPLEFWSEIARRAAPGFRIDAQAYKTKVYITFWADP